MFAAAGFVILGAGDAVMDVLWLGLALAKLRRPLPTVAALPPPRHSGKLAVFIPAWDE